MGIKFTTESFGTPGNILQIPDHFVCVPQYFEKNSSLASVVDGRKIIKAGTIFPANDATAKGVVFQDYDVTDGDQNGALLVHGFLNTAKLPAAPSNAAKQVLKNIEFFPLVPAEFGQVATPTADPDGGEFADTESVELACATSGADIYFTTDGSTPSSASTKYTAAITVSATTTIKAIAIKSGLINSEVMSKTFTKAS